MRHLGLLRENLLIQFSVASFLILAVIAVILANVLSRQVRSDAVNDLVHEAVGASTGRLIDAITPADLDSPMRGERYDEFHKFVQTSIISDRTARIKIRSKDGTIIYADNQDLVGKAIPPNQVLLDVLRGETVPVLKVPKDSTHASEEGLGALMEVMTPIVFPGSTEPQGGFALYQYYEPTAQRIADLRRSIYFSIGLGFLVLYASLVSIVWGGWRTITRQRGSLETVNAELETSVEELRVSNEKLEQSNQELQDFASAAAHDLQEPLRKVQAFGDRLAAQYSDALTERGLDYLTRMQSAAGRMRSLIDGLLTLSRVTSKAQDFTQVDLRHEIEEVLSDLEVHLEQASGTVQLGDLPIIDADPLQMRLLFQNLIGNSLKFCRPEAGPVVKIHGQFLNGSGPAPYQESDVDGLYQITVEDNGIGFDEKYLDRLFAIFQRLHPHGAYDGNGVGLAVCRKIVERHKGNITATSVPGEGATFSVTLPAKHPRGE
ncbi:MAG: ATP-binding protein [Dehalococcoidia bacterium]